MKRYVDTGIKGYRLRFACAEDVPLILDFIKLLAEYEGLAQAVTADEELLRESLFTRKAAEVIIGEYKGEPVSFAVFLHTFSTLLGKPGMHIEDIYVKPEFRGNGFGKVIFSYIASLAVERKCGRLEWWCLDWNEAALEVYKHMGAEPLDYITIHRMSGEGLDKLASGFNE